MGWLVAITLAVILFVVLTNFSKRINTLRDNNLIETTRLSDSLKSSTADLAMTRKALELEMEKNKTVVSQKKSSETRLGQISEHLVPFLANCKYDPKSMHFLGQPIDYIVFDFDEGAITFVEVKSGNSKPNKRQKIIKNIIKTGRVFFEEIRINEKGIKTKTTEND